MTEDAYAMIDLSEGRRQEQTPTLNKLVKSLSEIDDGQSEEFEQQASLLKDLIGVKQNTYYNSYFNDGNGWAILTIEDRKQIIMLYVYMELGAS